MKNKYNDHSKVLTMIADAQTAESDQRDAAREAKLFLTKRDGQWDPYAINKLEGRYRGTFDMCTPIVEQISGEIESADFSLNVSPAGGDSSMGVAKTFNGLIRNIKNISNADGVFNAASRSNVVCGFDAVEIVQDYVDGDSFDQDLIIKRVPNAIDSVWFDTGSTEQDRSDAQWCVKLVAKTRAEYDEMFPDGSGVSVGDDKQNDAFFNKAEFVTIGQLYYKKPRIVELVRMSDGSVFVNDDNFKSVIDEYDEAGITVADTRVRKTFRVYSRLLDGSDWLADEEQTVFESCPIVPIYGNFDIIENKVIYHGKIEKLYDQQRGLNYAMSRDIDDGALSPKRKYWGTPEQIEGFESSIETLNTNNDALQLYNHVDGQSPPFVQGGAVASNGLQTTIQNMQQMISASANSFDALQGNSNPMQSGIAGEQQIEQGNTGSIKWFKARKAMETQVGKVLIKAIPRVYDSTRQIRILEEDGTNKMITLNQTVFDSESKRNIELNNLAKGSYDVICDYGPAFNSQQKETSKAFLDMAQIDPSFLQQGKDIMLKNLSVPGMDQMAERARVELLNAGMIPDSQWTDEERAQIEQQKAEAANQPPQEDPMMIAARAEEAKAQAEQMNAQNKQQETQMNAQIKMADIQLRNRIIDLDTQKFLREKDDKYNVDAATIQQNQQKIDLQSEKQQFEAMFKMQEQQQKELTDAINNLKSLKDAMGVDAIIGQDNTAAYNNQAEMVVKEQKEK